VHLFAYCNIFVYFIVIYIPSFISQNNMDHILRLISTPWFSTSGCLRYVSTNDIWPSKGGGNPSLNMLRKMILMRYLKDIKDSSLMYLE
jgi:hypothetical protein